MVNLANSKTNVPMPRYYQARLKIEENIISGTYKQGEKLPTEKELSSQLGVSMITTRRALDEMVQEGIVEKVWGRGIYVKKSSFSSKAVRTIALPILYGEKNRFHMASEEFMRGLVRAFENKSYIRLEMVFITEAMLKENDYSMLTSRAIDGFIASLQEMSDSSLEHLRKSIPHIIALNHPDFHPCINFDYEGAMEKIMEHLLVNGHRKIALIGGPGKTFTANSLLRGYKKYLKRNKLEFNGNLVCNGEYTRASGFEMAKNIIAKENISAIVAGDDNMAAGVLDAISESGLKCPQDISVCSFNDFSIARLVSPSLTTIKVPFEEMGYLSGKALVAVIEGKDFCNNVQLDGDLIIRESVGPKRGEQA